MSEWKLGIYCHPDAVSATPDYAKRLVEEAGVDHFVLRSGYDLSYPESQEKAVQVIRDLEAKVCFMVGTWWGGERKAIENLPYKSFESSMPMQMPGSAIDAQLIAKLQNLCNQFQPDSICMTHARYRHPAYLDGIFDEGREDQEYQVSMEAAGIPRSDVLSARASWEKAMGTLDNTSLIKASERGLIEFLCELSQSDAIKRLIAFRRKTVLQSLVTIREAVKKDGILFGANAYSPWGADLCGQDYNEAYSKISDFVQPLLCYMEWHRYEPIAAWGRYLHQYANADEPVAVEAAKTLFGLGGAICLDSFNELDACVEGNGEAIYSIVSKEIKMCRQYLSKPYRLQPVLRGRQWDWAVTGKLVEEAKALGMDSFIFSGCEYLLKGPAPAIAGMSATAGWY